MKPPVAPDSKAERSPSRFSKVRSFLKRAGSVSLSPFDPLRDAAHFLTQSVRKHFPVVHNGRLVGILSLKNLTTALRERGEWVPVAEVMTKNPHAIASSRIPGRGFFRIVA